MPDFVSQSGKQTPSKVLQSVFPLPSNLRPVGLKTTRPRRDNPDDDEKYFNEDEAIDRLQYQPAPGSPANNDDDCEEDPLDAYMNSIEMKAKEDLKKVGSVRTEKRAVRQDIEEEDCQESFFRWLEENPEAGVCLVEDTDEVGKCEDGINRRIIEPLEKIDHTLIDYADFNKNFYFEQEDIKAMSPHAVSEFRTKLQIAAHGFNVPRPVSSFAHFGFDDQLMDAIRRSQFVQPTPIQCQAIPAILSGRDVIGIAETGTGKTLAFIWPALVHIMDQPDLKEGDGPIVLICTPTRELAQQIHTECRRYGRVYNIESGCVFGGAGMHEQVMMLKSQPREILVCTPGRLIDLIAKKKVINLQRVTYLVFDEADRMFDMGFEAQVRSIADHVRPDRQCLLFSATFKPRIEKLARDILNGEVVRILHGGFIGANRNIEQTIEVFENPANKFEWLLSRIVEFMSNGKVIVFVNRKENCVLLAENLKAQVAGDRVGFIHGDILQIDRDERLKLFKRPVCDDTRYDILVATDVAARGLDIRSIKTVVNYDVAKDIETHIHRIGRTARAGDTGRAFTLIVRGRDKEFSPHLVRNLEQSGQIVSDKLLRLALENGWFARSRSSHKASSLVRPIKTRKGLGYKEKPEALGPMADYRGVSAKGVHMNCPQPQQKLSALRNSYQTQFQSNFVKANDVDSGHVFPSVAVPNNVTKKRSKQEGEDGKKKSRWGDE